MFISWIEAFTRVGRAKYGSDWIDRLTEREKYLIDQYCDVPVEGGLPEYSVSKPRKARPIGAALEDEVGRADDRRRFKIVQDEYASKWLKANGFRSTYPRVNLFDLNTKIQEEFIFGDWWSEDGFFEAYWFEEDDALTGLVRSNPTRLDGAPTLPDKIVTLTAPALGMDECEAKSKESAASPDWSPDKLRGAIEEEYRPYPLLKVRPKRELSGRVWDFFRDLDQKGQLQCKKQHELYHLIRNRFRWEIISMRTMRRILGL
jgi:hypothetical protein